MPSNAHPFQEHQLIPPFSIGRLSGTSRTRLWFAFMIMCAIAGLLHCGDPDLLKKVVGVMAHRGPDSRGSQWFSRFNSGLGHCRLSILDLSPTGHQPMTTPGERYWITYNGEIYNYEQIRSELKAHGFQFRSSGDTEVILRAYEVWGKECLQKFNGMFAFAIFDTLTGELFAARDQIGIKPFYYFHQGERLVFASEIKGLLECPFVDRRPDYRALTTPARFMISPDTGFDGILKLPPGHYLTFQAGRVQTVRYWEIQASEQDQSSDRELVDQMDELLQDAVRLQMIADRPVGAFLSGGLDSSIITALMRKHTSGDIHAFTIKFSEADQKFERMPDDSVYARRVATQLGLTFHEFELESKVAELLPKMVWHLDEPLSDPATINTFMISQAAHELGIVVLLNGVGGDEVFGGYRKHLACLTAEAYQQWVPQTLRKLFETTVDRLPVACGRQGFRYLRWLKRFASFASLPQADRYLASDLSLASARFEQFFPGHTYPETRFFKAQQPLLENHQLSYLTRMCLNDTRVFLPEHNLTYCDKAAMAAGIESRPPLTDWRVVEKMFTLPPRHRIRGNVQKHILKKVSERYLPQAIVHRPKAPFCSPLRAWMRGPLSEMVDDLLSDTSLKSRGLYHPGHVRALIEKDRCGIEDHGMVIWSLLTVELWFRTFFDHR
jgi:asparagine synthase (glutamine-hydrolysing)